MHAHTCAHAHTHTHTHTHATLRKGTADVFEMSLSNVSQCVAPGNKKDEIELQVCFVRVGVCACARVCVER